MESVDEWMTSGGRVLAGLVLAGLLLGVASDASALWLPPDFGANNPLLAIAIGDSLTYGVLGVMPRRRADQPYPTVVQNLVVGSVPGFVVLNRGLGGEPTDLGASRIGTELVAARPGFVLILEGTNDANAGESPFTIAQNLHTMVLVAKAHDTIPILGTIPPNFADGGANGIVVATNGLLRNIAAEEGVILADVYAAMNNPGFFGPGDDHPLQSGYDAMGAAFAAGLTEAIAESRALLGGVFVAGGVGTVSGAEVLTGRGRGHPGLVHTYAGTATSQTVEIDPYGGFPGGVQVALCDVNNDGVLDIVTGAGPGGGPHVQVFDGANPTGPPIASFFAFDPAFAGGVSVACGHLEGDTQPGDIVVAAGRGGGPHVRAFRYHTGASGGVDNLPVSFFAYAETFHGGVSVAVGRLSVGDTADAIVTGAGPGGGPHVRAWRYNAGAPGGVVDAGVSFFAYDGTFTGGVNVAIGRLAASDPEGTILTGAGRGGGPHVRAFQFAPADSGGVHDSGISFFAYAPDFTGGVHVAIADLDGDGTAEIVTGAGLGGGPHVRAFAPSDLSTSITSFFAYPPPYP